MEQKRAILVLTAANEAQARGYRAQLAHRRRQGLLTHWTDVLVVADAGGRRVGSGGSTLWVLHEVAARLLPDAGTTNLAELFAGRQVVIIHSGGDSRRLCAYAAQGKAFTPLPCDVPGNDGGPGQPAALFDLIAHSLTRLPHPAEGHVLIAAGDVLLTFDPADVDFAAAGSHGVVGVAYPGTAERGRRHGVYVSDRDGRVTDFLQKPDLAALRDADAIDPVGRVLIDTGLISLTPATVARWLDAAGVQLKRGRLSITSRGILADLLDGSCPPLDLYEQVLMAMSPRLSRDAYLELMSRSHTGAMQRREARHHRRLAHLFDHLHDTPFHCCVLPYCDFFHIGSSAELLGHIDSLSRTARTYGFANLTRAIVPDGATLDGSFIYNSLIESRRLAAGPGVLIESSAVRQPAKLPGRNLVVGWPPELKAALTLPAGWGVVTLPVGKRDHAAVLFGIDDDFKTSVDAGGTFGNVPLRRWLAERNLSEADVWPGNLPATRRTLWEARLWPVGDVNRVWGQVTWMRNPGARAPAAWRRTRRQSMMDLIRKVDHSRLIAQRSEVQRRYELLRLSDRIISSPDAPASRTLDLLGSNADAKLALKQIDALLDRESDPLLHARAMQLVDLIVRQHPQAKSAKPALARRALGGEAIAAVARSVMRDLVLPMKPKPAAILHDQVVWVTTPVRIDFAGGWSDTPPICAEQGGAVINAAITLNGQYPVQVVAKRSDQPAITLSSIDLGRREVISEQSGTLDYSDPTHWTALPKAALILAGVCPGPQLVSGKSGPRLLKHWLGVLGGGLDITIFSALPKGSGLGTSSVLGAAMLACLARVLGEPVTVENLIVRTSLLEQMMTTGGGWQDQVGGITPGVKLIRTMPGPDQTPMIHRATLDFAPGSELRSRTLLYFTGIKRMARDILHKVVGRYLARDPDSMRVIAKLKAGAMAMKTSLDAGDLGAFAAGVEEYWELKKSLDPGSTNPKIEALLKPLDRYLSARLLPGAGGGGFVFMITRDAAAARKVRQMLTQQPPNPLARFFDLDVDPHGLRVTVL